MFWFLRNIKRKVLMLGLAGILAGTAAISGVAIGDKQAVRQDSSFSIGIGEKVITIGTAVYAAGTADYTCDGVADNVQFQAAFDALPAAGGKISVLTGNYVFAATVTRAIPNVTIEGNGLSTNFTYDGINPIFTAGGNRWVFASFVTDAGGINLGATTGWQMQNVLLGATYYAYRSQTGQAVFNDVTAAALTDSGLTSGRLPVAGAGGLLGDSSNLTWNNPSLQVGGANVTRGATYVVAASDAPAHVKAQADYVCDGTADQVEIQAALNALPAGGGTARLSEGTFTITDTLTPSSHNHLQGSGAGVTVINVVNTWAGSQWVVIGSATLGSHEDIEIEGITFDATGADAQKNCIGAEGYYHSDDIRVHDCDFLSTTISGNPLATNTTDAYFGKVVDVGGGTNWKIYNNTMVGYGFEAVSCGHGTITKTYGPEHIIVANNYMEGGYGGVVFEGQAKYCVVVGNTMNISFNTPGGSYGALLYSANTRNNTITGNSMRVNGSGVEFWGEAYENTASGNSMWVINAVDIKLGAHHNKFIGNTVSGLGNTSPRVSVQPNSHFNEICDNTFVGGVNIMSIESLTYINGNHLAFSSSYGIWIRAGADRSEITNNYFEATGSSQVYLETADYIKITDNTFYDQSGTTTVITTLATGATIGQTTINASATALIFRGMKLYIDAETMTVSDIDELTNIVSLTAALSANHTSGSNVARYYITDYAVRGNGASDYNLIKNNTIRMRAATYPNTLDIGLNSILENTLFYSSSSSWLRIGNDIGTQTVSGTLTAGVANAICFAWHNPYGGDVIVKKVVIEVTTAGGTAGSHLDVGIADNATGGGLGTEFFNDLGLNVVQIHDSWVVGDNGTQTKWVVCQDSANVTDGWVVGQILDANAASLVGRWYIEFVGR